MNLIYYPSILKKGYPKYDDVINTFSMIDRLSGKDYLLNSSLEAILKSDDKANIYIKPHPRESFNQFKKNCQMCCPECSKNALED